MDGRNTSQVSFLFDSSKKRCILTSTGTASLVELAYGNSVKPKFVSPSIYDAACPAKNDPLPGRGAF